MESQIITFRANGIKYRGEKNEYECYFGGKWFRVHDEYSIKQLEKAQRSHKNHENIASKKGVL